MAASTATISVAGTITDTFCWSPMTRAAVTENTNTPTAKANVRHTIGSSRNRFSRGDRLLKAHCTTPNSSEKMIVTSPRTPKPTATSTSVTRVLATVTSVWIRGSNSPSPSPASAHSNWTRPARSRRRGRANRPSRRAAGDRITPPARGHTGTPSGNVLRLLPPICQFAGIGGGAAMRRRGLPRSGSDLLSSVISLFRGPGGGRGAADEAPFGYLGQPGWAAGSRWRGEPGAVAPGQRVGAEPVGEDAEQHGEGDHGGHRFGRGPGQVFQREQPEDDRGQAAWAEPAQPPVPVVSSSVVLPFPGLRCGDQVSGGMPLAMRFTPRARNSTVITASLCTDSHSFAESSWVFARSPPVR